MKGLGLFFDSIERKTPWRGMRILTPELTTTRSTIDKHPTDSSPGILTSRWLSTRSRSTLKSKHMTNSSWDSPKTTSLFWALQEKWPSKSNVRRYLPATLSEELGFTRKERSSRPWFGISL